MNRYGLIQGTWGFLHGSAANFWQKDSPFNTFMQESGWAQVKFDDPFVWTTNLIGGYNPLKSLAENHREWIAAAYALKYWMRDITYENRRFIVHSYGLNVLSYYFTLGEECTVRNWIAVGSPIRGDMLAVYNEGHQKYNDGFLITDRDPDWIKISGELSGKVVIGPRHIPFDIEKFRGPQHNRVLENRDFFHLWKERGWLDRLAS